MRPWLSIAVVMAMSVGPSHAQSQPGAAASAPAQAPDKRLNLELPKENPAVRANRQATMPGDLPSQRQNLKQIQIPFGKGDAGPTGGGGIDDSAARCRAKRTSEEREACEARLDNV